MHPNVKSINAFANIVIMFPLCPCFLNRTGCTLAVNIVTCATYGLAVIIVTCVPYGLAVNIVTCTPYGLMVNIVTCAP